MKGIGNTTPTGKRRADALESPPIGSKRILYESKIMRVGGRAQEGETNMARTPSFSSLIQGTGQTGSNALIGSDEFKNNPEGTQGRRTLKVVRKALFGKSSTASPTGAGRVFGRSSSSLGGVPMATDATDPSTVSGQTTESSQGLRRSSFPSLDLSALEDFSQLKAALPFLSPVKSQPNSEQGTPTSSMGSSPVAKPKQQKLSPWG